MKNKVLYLGSLLLLFSFLIGATMMLSSTSSTRYYQHNENSSMVNNQTSSGFTSHLPIVEIQTNGQKIPYSSYLYSDATFNFSNREITVDITFRDYYNKKSIQKKQDANTIEQSPDHTGVTQSKALIRYRGNSSRLFDKKSMQISLIDSQGMENKISVAGMGKHDEWVLHGPFLDRTLVRNYLCYNIAGEIMDYAPNVRFCELFLNGEYRGVYLIVESISRSENRLNLSKSDAKKDLTSFIVRWDRAGKGDHEINNFTTYTYKADVSGLDVRYPGSSTITDGQMEYIEDYISKVERALYSSDLYNAEKDYSKYIDVKEFANYFIINEFFRNVDAGRFSTFYYKDIRGKLKPCVWDFNNGCDNYIDYVWDEEGFSLLNAPWFSMLIKDEEFVEEVITQYRKLRKGVLNDDYLQNVIDETILYLGDAVDRNYSVWGYVFDLENVDNVNFLSPTNRNYTSYEEAVTQLKTYIELRGKWLDDHIESLYQYCQESKNRGQLIQ